MRSELSSLGSAAFRGAFVGELLCSVMCIELGAFLIVSTRPDDERLRAQTDRPMDGAAPLLRLTRPPKQTPRRRRARAVVFRRRRRHLFRMKESRTNSGKRRNTADREGIMWPARRDERMTTSGQRSKPTSRDACSRRRYRCYCVRGTPWCCGNCLERDVSVVSF